ncbi:MAG TPA: hypothetical protein VF041_05800 [Gemmatimonadaceae bacterium]
MSSSDWDKELARIDKQLQSISDDALIGPGAPPGPPASPGGAGHTRPAAEPGKVGERTRETSSFGVFARLVLAVALGVAMLFWPYSARCGLGLFGYLFATIVVIVSGGWSAIWTWRHRSAQGHILSLLLILWGLILGAQEVLPRVGYAKPDAMHPAIWMCE